MYLKFKKHKGSDSVSSLMGSDSLSSLMENCHKVYLHACLSEFLGEWLEVWTRGFIKDDVINGRFLNINQSIGELATLSTCTAILCVQAHLGILLLYLGVSVLEVVHWYRLSEGYGSNGNILKISER